MGEWGSVHNFFACRACRAGGAVPGCLEIRQHALKKAGPLAVGVHRWDGWKSGRADVSLSSVLSLPIYTSLFLSLSLSQPFPLSHLLKRRAVGPSDRRPSAPIGHGRVAEAPPHILTFFRRRLTFYSPTQISAVSVQKKRRRSSPTWWRTTKRRNVAKSALS